MIGPLGFATRNLQRRGFHSLLAFLGLTLTVTSTTFLLLLGQSLATRFNIGLYSTTAFGIDWLFFIYLLVSLAFVIIVGMMSVSYLVSSMINQRSKDIGTTKAAGALPNRLSTYFMAEAIIVIGSSCLVGSIAALVVYVFWSGFLFQFNETETLIVTGIPIISFLLSYLAAKFQLGRAMKAKTLGTISSALSTFDQRALGKPLQIKRLGSSFNLASKTVSRDSQFARTVIRISICIFLTMVVLTGAFVSWDTSKGYVEQAMPRQTLIIGASPVVNAYLQLAQSFSKTVSVPKLNYLNGTYSFDPKLANTIRAIPGVEGVNPLLITLDNVTGYVKAHFASSGGQLSGETVNQQIIPEAYTGSSGALIVGVNPNQTVENWYNSNGLLVENDSYNTMVVGDSLVGNIIQTPFNLSQVGWLGHRFNVKGAVVDPLNTGRVVYTQLGFLENLLGVNRTNIMLVKTGNSPATLLDVQKIATQNGLVVASQDPALDANLDFLDNTWMYLSILPILTLGLTCGILLSYLTTNYSKRFNDYVVLKVLGANARYVLRVLLWEGWGMLAICLAIALPAAYVVSATLLVPGAKIQGQNLLFSAILSFSALTIASSGAAAIYARRLRFMTVKDLKL